MLTIMTNVAMNNKAGVIGGVAAMLIITLSIPMVRQFCTCLPEFLKHLWVFFVAILVNYDIDRLRSILEKKRKIMLQDITLLIDD